MTAELAAELATEMKMVIAVFLPYVVNRLMHMCTYIKQLSFLCCNIKSMHLMLVLKYC